MRIKKFKINNYDAFLYKTKKYTSINMLFLFELPYTKDNIYMCDLLEEYILHTSKVYETRKSINDKKRELYSIGTGFDNYNIGEKLFVEMTVSLVDPKYVKDDYLESAFVFLRDYLLTPNFVDGKLNQDELNRCKDNLTTRIKDHLVGKSSKSMDDLRKQAYPNTYRTIDIIENIEEYQELLNSYSDEKLIDMYEKLIHNSLVGLLIMGDVDDKIIKYIEKYFQFKNAQKFDDKFKAKLKINKRTSFYKRMVDQDHSESILRVLYECPARSKKDRITYTMISKMFKSSGMLIHKVLREELKLIYSAGCSYSKRLDTLTFVANIDRANEEKTIEAIDDLIERLKDPKLIQELLDKIKEENELELYTFDESKWNMFDDLYDLSFKLDTSFKNRCKIMETVTVQDIIDALNKMKKAKIHFYEGAKR